MGVRWARGVVHEWLLPPPWPWCAPRVGGYNHNGRFARDGAGGLRGPANEARHHQWSWGRVDAAGNGWGFRCQGCLRTCRTLESKARAPCGEALAVARIASHAALKHSIVAARVGGSTEAVAFCTRCGGYSSRQARLLGAVCEPKPFLEQRVRRAFEKRRHPKIGKSLSYWEKVASWE